MNSKEALEIIGAQPCVDDAVHAAYDRLAVDARALWAVRVLDAWSDRNPGELSPTTGKRPLRPDVEESGAVHRVAGEYCVWIGSATYWGPTPDAARIAAAEALIAADPSLDPDALRSTPEQNTDTPAQVQGGRGPGKDE